MSVILIGKKLLIKYPSLINLSASLFNSILGLNKIKIKGTKNTIQNKRAFMKKCKITIVGNNNSVILGDKTYLENTSIVIMGNNNNINLKNLVCIYNVDFHIEDSNNKISIGYKTLICAKAQFACIEGTEISVGENCLISSDVIFRTGDSHSVLNMSGERINQSLNITIEDHVWLSNKTTVIKGSYISKDSIVATGAVVTRQFYDSNVILGGIPAAVIKKQINWDHNRL